MPPAVQRLRTAAARLVGAEVYPGEWHLVLLFFGNLFLLLAAYYVLKVIREPLILLQGGAVQRSYARGLQAGILLLLVPAYGWLANRFEPARLVKWIMSVCVACVAIFVVLGGLGVAVGFAFFVWLGIFSILAIAQFWSLATDVMSESEGKRLFPIIAAGGTLGGIVGAQLAARWVDARPFQLMLLAAGILVVCAALTHVTHQAGEAHRRRLPVAPRAPRDPRGGLSLVAGDRYLWLVAASVAMLSFIDTTGDFLLAELVADKARALPGLARRAFIAAFYGDLQTYVSVLTAVVQILVVGRVFKRLGVMGSLPLLPAFALLGYGACWAVPVLPLLTLVKTVEGGAGYSLQNTLQQALFLPTSHDAKYKAKAAIDTLFVRLGDLASTGVVFVGAAWGVGGAGYALANFLMSGAWLWVTFRLRAAASSASAA